MFSATRSAPQAEVRFIDSLEHLADQVKQTGINFIYSMSAGAHFLAQYCKDPTTVGALFPSSDRLAEKMVRFLPAASSTPRHYLEVGPGTGPFTKHIVKKLGPNDHLDLVELNPKFCQLLRDQYANFPNVHIHEVSILEWQAPYKYDAIVSGLPLNSFKSEAVASILERLKDLTISQSGKISFFEYIGLPHIKKQLLSSEHKRDFQKVLDLKARFFDNHGIAYDNVWLNLPPARVRHFEISS